MLSISIRDGLGIPRPFAFSVTKNYDSSACRAERERNRARTNLASVFGALIGTKQVNPLAISFRANLFKRSRTMNHPAEFFRIIVATLNGKFQGAMGSV